MKKVKFLFQAMKNMDFKNMFHVVRNVSKKARKPFLWIFIDVIYCGIHYQAGYMDYQEFEFYLLNKSQRKTYLTRGKNNALVRKYNDKSYWHILQNKVEFNEKFKDYIKRDFIDLRSASIKDFEKFAKGKDVVIAKELDNSGGKGISKVELKKEELSKIYESLKEKKQYLVEELILQNKKVNELNPSSVNTLRLFTFFDGKESHVINCIFKIGNGGFVDNFSSGGMYTFVGTDGKVLVPAIDVLDHKIEIHPVSKKKLVGFQVPNYEKAVGMVEEASKLVPQIRYIGWDVAILENDVCLVEGNEYPGVFQIKPSFVSGEPVGLIPEYQKYMEL